MVPFRRRRITHVSSLEPENNVTCWSWAPKTDLMRRIDRYEREAPTERRLLERVSIEYRESKIKVITLSNQKGRRQSSKPIKTHGVT